MATTPPTSNDKSILEKLASLFDKSIEKFKEQPKKRQKWILIGITLIVVFVVWSLGNQDSNRESSRVQGGESDSGEIIGDRVEEEAEEEESEGMPDLVGSTVSDARSSISNLDASLEVTETDASGDDRTIVVAGNWKVCSQSINEGESISDGDLLEITYAANDQGLGDEEDCDTVHLPDEGVVSDFVGETLSDARNEIREISEDITINTEDYTGAERASSQAFGQDRIVCTQSVEAGETITEEDEITFTFVVGDEDCITSSDWASSVEEQWLSYRSINSWSELSSEDISSRISEITSEELGVLEVHLDSSPENDPMTAEWGTTLPRYINSTIDDDTMNVENVHVYKDGERLGSDLTTKGLSRHDIHRVCENRLSQYGLDTDVKWMTGLRSATLDRNGSAWRVHVAVEVDGQSGEMICIAGGELNSQEVLDFELRL